jgi:hypothetical protein
MTPTPEHAQNWRIDNPSECLSLFADLDALLSAYAAHCVAEMLAEKDAEIARLKDGLETIVSKFTKDLEQGYKTGDKVFAIDIASFALQEMKP